MLGLSLRFFYLSETYHYILLIFPFFFFDLFIHVCTLDPFAFDFIPLLSCKKSNAGDSFIPDLHNSENFAAWLSRDQLGKVSYQTCSKTGEKRDATYFCKYFTNFVELSKFEGWNQLRIS
jgi:hypothetical protein